MPAEVRRKSLEPLLQNSEKKKNACQYLTENDNMKITIKFLLTRRDFYRMLCRSDGKNYTPPALIEDLQAAEDKSPFVLLKYCSRSVLG